MGQHNHRDEQSLGVDAFRQKLEELVGREPIKIWLAKSHMGRIEVVFAIGQAQGKPIRNFDHIGGFYLMGENIPPEYIGRIHDWFVAFSRGNFTPHRLDRHVVDVRFRTYYDRDKKYHDQMVMHAPVTVHPPSG